MVPSSSILALPRSPPARTVGPQCQGIVGLAWKGGLWVGGSSPSGQVSMFVLSGWPQAPSTDRVHGIWMLCQGLSWLCWVPKPLRWAQVCWGAMQDSGHLPGQDQPSALNAALYSVPELLSGGHGPP